MEKDSLPRILIRSAADKWLRDIETDPKRTVRRLIDMGRQFAKGGYQQTFFELVANMLEDEDSAYYELISRMAREVDHGIIKEFGVGLGYNSWTTGAECIRKKEKELGYNIPWNVVLEYDAAAPEHMPLSELNRVIREGRALGVYTYFVKCRSGLAAVLSLCQNNPDCAFVLMLDEPITAAGADALFETKNAVVATSGKSRDFSAQAELMLGRRLLYGATITYSDGDEVWMADGGWLDEFVDAGCYFLLLEAEPGCSTETMEAVSAAVTSIRNGQRRPLFLVDMASDIRFVDRVISDEPCYFGISAAGLAVAAVNRGKHMAEAIKGSSLVAVMERIMPKLGYTEKEARGEDKKAI